MINFKDIDWTDANAQVSEHFTVHDMIYLKNWGRLATIADGMVPAMIYALANKMEEVRAILNHPMYVLSCYRSPEYNHSQGIIPMDAHAQNCAMDFHCLPMACDDVKDILLPHLEALGLRMENNGRGAGWVHLDTRPVGNARYFLP